MHDCLYFPKVSKNMLNLIFFFNYKVQKKKKKAHKENKRVKEHLPDHLLDNRQLRHATPSRSSA